MPIQPTPKYTYIVFVDDNFHYMDESERYELGEFYSCESAIAACKAIVDEFLLSDDTGNATPEQLCAAYTMFGEDPFIVTKDPDCSFSAWDYAKQRCIEILQK